MGCNITTPGCHISSQVEYHMFTYDNYGNFRSLSDNCNGRHNGLWGQYIMDVDVYAANGGVGLGGIINAANVVLSSLRQAVNTTTYASRVEGRAWTTGNWMQGGQRWCNTAGASTLWSRTVKEFSRVEFIDNCTNKSIADAIVTIRPLRDNRDPNSDLGPQF
jgi:hypothetical protein